MYYSLFEGQPYADKVETAIRYYKFLLPKVQKIEGYLSDSFYLSPHVANKSVNVEIWDDEGAVRRWRNEANHLNAQEKASHGVYDSYRLRLGPIYDQDSTDNDSDAANVRQYVTLYYRDHVEEPMPVDDVTSLLGDEDASEMRGQMLDSSVYQGPSTLWISAWRTKEAAASFDNTIRRRQGGEVVHVRVERDYTKTDRKDAPHEIPGTKL